MVGRGGGCGCATLMFKNLLHSNKSSRMAFCKYDLLRFKDYYIALNLLVVIMYFWTFSHIFSFVSEESEVSPKRSRSSKISLYCETGAKSSVREFC